MEIELRGSTPPADQIREQISGLIAAGRMGASEKLPSVRQLARDLGVAPGTVAKAYRALETDGYVEARAGGSTRVSAKASPTARPVIEAARHLSVISASEGVSLDEAIRLLRVVWPN